MANTGDRGFEAGRTNPPAGQERRTEGAKEGGMVSAVTDRIKDIASTAAHKAEDAWDTTRDTAQEWASAAGHGVETAWDSVNGFFRRYPLPMFLVGIGVGFLMAKAFGNMQSNASLRRMNDYSAR